MGAWGINTFENGDAADWLAEFCDEPDKELLVEAFESVNNIGDNYLEAPESSAALAAAEVIAALLGKPSANLPDEAKDCLAKLKLKPSEKLVASARKAVERIKTDTELKELWDESDHAARWQATVEDLAARLK